MLTALGLTDAEIRRVTPAWAERLVRFLTHPLVSSLLTTIAIVGIVVELRTPGFGVPGALGIGSLAVFFWGHWLVRLAGWEEVLLVAAGRRSSSRSKSSSHQASGWRERSGLGALLGGLGLSLVGSRGDVGGRCSTAAGQVVVSLLLAIAASLAMLRFLPRLPFGRRLVLATELEARDGLRLRAGEPT